MRPPFQSFLDIIAAQPVENRIPIKRESKARQVEFILYSQRQRSPSAHFVRRSGATPCWVSVIHVVGGGASSFGIVNPKAIHIMPIIRNSCVARRETLS